MISCESAETCRQLAQFQKELIVDTIELIIPLIFIIVTATITYDIYRSR